jgi:hypothetical protein
MYASQSPSSCGLRKSLFHKTEDSAGLDAEDRFSHAARIHLVFLLVGNRDALLLRCILRLSRPTLNDHSFLAIVIGNRACWIGSEVLTFAGFASSRKEESVIQPHSPHRHNMRTRLPRMKTRVNRGQPERSAVVHFPGNPSPREQTLTVFSSDNAIARRKRTVRLGLRLRGRLRSDR